MAVAVLFTIAVPAGANGVGGASGMESAPAAQERSGAPTPSSMRALKERIIEIQNRSPLVIDDFRVCRKIDGYASYVPFENNVVTNAREVYFYYEPVNLYTSVTAEGYALSFAQDMLLLSAAGEVLYNAPRSLTFFHRGNKPALDVYGRNKLDISGLAPGEYVFKIVIYDELSGSSAEKSLSFVIR
jgi:hypothetical protein